MKTKDPEQGNIPITVVGFNHQTANIALRERATFNESQQTSIIQRLAKDYNTRGVLVLSTCNRTELYVSGRKATKFISEICSWLDKKIKENIFCNEEITYIFKGRQAIQHFFRVITSLDSQMVGEPQITGQVKEAYENSRQLGHTDILLNKMYNFGMQVEKQVRSKTYLTDGAVSISFAGVEMARKIFGNLHNTVVLLIGAGEIAELAALHFSNREVSQILVVNRTLKKARSLASKYQGKSIPMEDLYQTMDRVDIVITATSSDNYIIDKVFLEKIAKKRDYKPIFLIDLAVPRNIDPSVSDIDGVFLYNLDALEDIVGKNIEHRMKEIPKAEKIVESHVSEYINWYNTLPVVKTIKLLSHYFEDIRKQEFNRLKNRFPKESLAEVEYLSKSLMKKFLHHHIMTLRRSNQDPRRQKQHIDLVGEIYRFNESDPDDDKKN